MKKPILFNFIISFTFLPCSSIAFAQDGTLDLSFSGDGVTNTPLSGVAEAISLQNDHKIVVAGRKINGSYHDISICRYNEDGSLDPAFDMDGMATFDFAGNSEFVNDILIQPDGKILIAGGTFVPPGSDTDFMIVRLNTDGTLDSTFGVDGVVINDFGNTSEVITSIALQSDGKIIAGGSGGDMLYPDFTIARYETNGDPDLSFDSDGLVITDFSGTPDGIQDLTIQPDGKILAAGFTYTSDRDYAIARYNSDGSLDMTFGSGGKTSCAVGASDDYGNGLALQPDGKIILGGASKPSSVSAGDFSVARFNPDGSLDLSFSADGKLIYPISGDDFGNDILLQSDGKIVICGYGHPSGIQLLQMLRVSPDGAIDNTFDSDGLVIASFSGNNYSNAVIEDNEGRLVNAGSFNENEFLVARYYGNTAGLNETQSVLQVETYPNPVTGSVTLKFEKQVSDGMIQVSDLSGQIIYSEINISGTEFCIDFTDQPAGIYILGIYSDEISKQIKIVRE